MAFQNNNFRTTINNNVMRRGNWLSNDKFAFLQNNLSPFKLSVEEEDVIRGQCNHYNQDGALTLIEDENNPNLFKCSLCGTVFESKTLTEADVKKTTKDILDILNMIKVMYISSDASSALQFFQIIPFIEKIPELYKIAIEDFNRRESIVNYNAINQSNNPISMFNNLVSGGFYQPMGFQQMGGFQQQQPMNNGYQQPMGFQQQQPMNNGYQQPMGFQQQQQMNPLYQQPMGFQQQQPMNNGYQQPMGNGYQPNMTDYSLNPSGGTTVNTNMPVQPQPDSTTNKQDAKSATASVTTNTKGTAKNNK